LLVLKYLTLGTEISNERRAAGAGGAVERLQENFLKKKKFKKISVFF
jgi:hypothetical protein